MARIEYVAFVQGYDAQRNSGKDPVFEIVGSSGVPKLTFSTCETHSRRDDSGGFVTTGRTFRRVVAWRELAQQFQNLAPGTRVEVIGNESTREFQKDDGSRGYITETVARYISVVPSRNGNQQGQQPQQSYQQGQPQQPQQTQQTQADPWGAQQGNYNWGTVAYDTPPF